MTLDQAIKEFNDWAKESRKEQSYFAAERDETSPFDPAECNRIAEDAETRAEYYEQLALWLMDLKEARQYLMEAVDGFKALGKELDEKCELKLDCSKCPLNNGGNCRSWKRAKTVMKLIGGK